MPGFAHADDDLMDVTLDPSGTFGPEFIIDESNILPGDSFTRKIIITNKTPETRNVKIRFSSTSYSSFNTGLESEILVEIKKSNGDPIVFPFPAGTTLKSLYDETAERDFDTLGSGALQRYKVIFTFNPLATDQSKTRTRFDITLGIYSDVVPTDDDEDGEDEEDAPNDDPVISQQGLFSRVFGTETTPTEPGATEGVQTTDEEQQGLLGEGQENKVAGAVTTCKGWPLWVWILSIIIFALNFWRNARKNYKAEKYKWIHPLIWTILAVLFWYFFDKCREYIWFWKGSVGIAIVSHFIYIWFLKQKVKKGLPVEKEETAEMENK